MQTILGANGPIAEELTKELYRNYTKDIRLVSRNPKKVNDSDQLFPANLLDAKATSDAVVGSEIAYLTVGLPMDSELWEQQFPTMMRNVIAACNQHQCKLVFFDNTYMYAKTAEPQTEESRFIPVGRKSKVRAELATMLLAEIANKQIEAVICRAPEFYGPGKTQSLTNSLIFNNIEQNQKLKVFLRDNVVRTLIWTPDASRAMALIGNTPDAYGQTWHLPCDDHRLTYKQLIELASQIYQRDLSYSVLKMWQLNLASLFNKQVREVKELLPRYRHDNFFISDKFKNRFPEFRVTTYAEGVKQIKEEQNS